MSSDTAAPARPAPAPQRLRVEPVRLLATARTERRRLLRWAAGWPLKYLLVGFPLWWALGLNTLIFPLMAVPMLWQLRRLDRVRVPPAMSLWTLFMLWQLFSLVTFGLNPPTTHAGTAGGRLVSIAFTLVEYAGVTVALLYTGNLSRRDVPQSAIGRWLGWFFLTVCAGGFLGLIAPHFGFRSAIEYLLPTGVRTNSFVKALVHPVAAQVQDVIGTGNGRPAAPFGYTNLWGNALSILLVWFIAAWVVPAWRRKGLPLVAGLVVVVITIVPVVLSLNRGLWVGLGVSGLWILVRMLSQGHVGRVLVAVGVLMIGLATFALSPLTTVIDQRLQNGVSDNIRQFVAEKSIIAIEHSPVLGYGAPRKADGSQSSIAVGQSARCPNCGEVATGSTGQLWSVMFNNGAVGAALYFGFFLAALWVFRRQRGANAEAALLTIALGFVYMLFYSALPVAPTLTMIAVAVLWREHDAARGDAGRDGAATDGADGADGADEIGGGAGADRPVRRPRVRRPRVRRPRVRVGTGVQ